VNPRFDDRIDRAGFLAEPAIDAFEQVDVIARRSARAVFANIGFDRYRERRAYGFAQLAGDAPLLPVRVAFSSGYWTVTFLANRFLIVTPRPLISSVIRKVLTIFAT
jgi:hypothetical protein